MSASFSASQLLGIWETGLTLTPLRRALLLASLLTDEVDARAVSSLPVGERDAQILKVRQKLFGDAMSCLIRCPDCDQSIEFVLRGSDFLSTSRSERPEEIAITMDGYEMTVRVPTSADLLEVAAAGDLDAARKHVLRRCVITAKREHTELPASEFPEAVTQRIVEAMEEYDPLAALEIAVSCPYCSRRWNVPFDIGVFLWAEIQAWSKRLLLDVHTLAAAYGWHEADILNLSLSRRQHYLQLVMG
ncbi:MAG: hypothetical protein L0H94_00325 [Nitrospira sp.]|nr:hypothetical protein [Nitrospira sp.]